MLDLVKHIFSKDAVAFFCRFLGYEYPYVEEFIPLPRDLDIDKVLRYWSEYGGCIETLKIRIECQNRLSQATANALLKIIEGNNTRFHT